MPNLKDYLEITAAFATIVAAFLAIYAIVVKRNELFRGSIYNRQIDELILFRSRLISVWYQLHYMGFWSRSIASQNRTLARFETEQPDDWAAYKKFQEEMLAIYYTCTVGNHWMFPEWFAKPDREFVDALESIAPFTFSKLSEKSASEIVVMQNILLKQISRLDDSIRSRR